MPKQPPTIDRELEDVLSRAQSLHPRLLARRAEIAAELATVDAALAQLRSLGGKLGSVTTAPVAKASASPSVTRKRRAGSKSLTAKKLMQPVLFALGRFSEPVGSAEVLKALRAKGLAVKPYPLQMALKRLRDEGHVRASGKTRRFLYGLAPTRREGRTAQRISDTGSRRSGSEGPTTRTRHAP